MTENTWANKYRPIDIDSVVGQERVKNELKTLNRNGKMPQAILLTGDSGIGKTTLAYIIAKLGKCTNLLEDGSACNTCSECLKMNELILSKKAPMDIGVHFYNVSKLNSSIDAEEVVEKMARKNSLLDNKIYYILDEFHVATELSQSRYLEVTEEQPKGMYAIMTTTNEEKLLDTLKSRFIQYKLIKPKISDIVERLEYICQQEGVDYQKSALNLIAKSTNRNLRMAINKVEELSSFGDLTKANVTGHFDIMSESMFYNFITAVNTNNLSSVSRIYNQIEDSNLTFNHFVTSFGEFIVDLIDISNLLYPEMYTSAEIKRYKEYVERFSNKELMGLIRITNSYYDNTNENKFVFYSFATELMSLFNEVGNDTVETPVEQTTIIENSKVSREKLYRDVTEKIKETSQEEVTVEKEMSTSDVEEFFGNSVIVSEEE